MTDASQHARKITREVLGPDAPDDLVSREATIIAKELARRAPQPTPAQPSPLAGLPPADVCRVILGRSLQLMAAEGVPEGVATAELVKAALASMACRLGDPALLPGWLEALAEGMRSDPPPNFSVHPSVN